MTFDEAVKFLRATYDDPGICEVVDKATAPVVAVESTMTEHGEFHGTCTKRSLYGPGGLLEGQKIGGAAAAPKASEELKQAFRLAYDAYSTPADKYSSDLDYIVFLRTKITACFSILQKLVYPK